MKKVVKAFLVIILILLAVAGGYYGYRFLQQKKDAGSKENAVYVQSVADLTGIGQINGNRYSGVVETQKTEKINPDGEKKIAEVFVAEGDTVQQDDPLFTYDTASIKLDIESKKLEIERDEMTIENDTASIEQLNKAMEKASVQILAHGLALKPGMAGAYGICWRQRTADDPDFFPEKNGTDMDAAEQAEEDRIIPVFGLSGNPAACMTAFYAVVLPVLRRQMGIRADACIPARLRVRLAKDYSRKNQSSRLLRGKVDLTAAVHEMEITGGQGNQVLSSLAGSNAFAEIPAGMAVKAEEPVDAFLIDQL